MGLRRRKQEGPNTLQPAVKKTSKIPVRFRVTKEWIEKSFGFPLNSLASLDRFTLLLYKRCDGSSLAAIRIMFGIIMLIDTMEERGFSNAEKLWGDPNECRFPLINFLRPMPVQLMCLLYLIMCIGAIGISLGLYYRHSCLALSVPYWYILLLNKASWNNHSYLFGLLQVLMALSSANNCWSLDKYVRNRHTDGTVPLWNYAIIRFQVFALYFFAGLKKIDSDWLSGYSMTTLSKHWVFNPFKLLLSLEQVDLWIVHITGFLLDFTAGFLVIFESTRCIAFVFLSMFHLMNSRLFQIGMFPYMCLITMPVFCRMDWPKHLYLQAKCFIRNPFTIFQCTDEAQSDSKIGGYVGISIHDLQRGQSVQVETEAKKSVSWKKQLTSIGLLLYVIFQCFLPYSHFVTKGYNNWTNGLYGYSWDMMVHTWDRHRIIVKIVDKSTQQEYFLNHETYAPTDRWATHADMVVQFAQCVNGNLKNRSPSFNNISIHIDVWCSLNGRFQQRMFDPNVDLLTAPWSPFTQTEWVMPLMNDLSDWRDKITSLQNELWSWSNYSDVLFYADFPGLTLENYIRDDLQNITLTILEGSVILETTRTNKTLTSGEIEPIPKNTAHLIHTVSETPSCYMYSFINGTQMISEDSGNDIAEKSLQDIFLGDVVARLNNLKKVLVLITKMCIGCFY